MTGDGRPLRYDVFTGHYSGAIYLPYILDVAARWFLRRCEQPVPADRAGLVPVLPALPLPQGTTQESAGE